MQKQDILRQLTELEEIQDQRLLFEDEVYLRAVVLSVKFEEIAKKEEVAWRQRPRALSLKEDLNTKFFHRTANCHRRYNNIDSLLINGTNIVEPTEIKREIIELYQNLYSEPEAWRPHSNLNSGPLISEEDSIMLQSQFGEQEIRDCVMACAGDKAPGPDGFSMAFFNQLLGCGEQRSGGCCPELP